MKDVTLNIEKGKKTLFLGENGSGKSTLFLIMNGLLNGTKRRHFILRGKKVKHKKKGFGGIEKKSWNNFSRS